MIEGRNTRPAGLGFTLIELLVVIVIIAVLIAITLAVGQGVVQSQRTRLAQDSIRVLDAGLDSYVRTVGSLPPVVVEVPNEDPGLASNPDDNILLPFADASPEPPTPSDESLRTTVNTSGLLLRLLDDAGLGDILRPLEGEALAFYDADDTDTSGNFGNRQPELRSVLDPWGNPIRVVHPRFDGIIRDSPPSSPGDRGDYVVISTGAVDDLLVEADLPGGYTAADLTNPAVMPVQLIRRNRLTDADRDELIADGVDGAALRGDADGGICPAGRPYAYSAGADGDPSTITDNAYTTEPTFSVD